jgi:hypothetical protein
MVTISLYFFVIMTNVLTTISQQMLVYTQTTLDPIRAAEISMCRNLCGDTYFSCKIIGCVSRENTSDATENEACHITCTKQFRNCFRECAKDKLLTTLFTRHRHTIDANSLIITAPPPKIFTGYATQDFFSW